MDTSKLREMVADSSRIVYFGGAGTSTESQIPDFRSETGLYTIKNGPAYPPEVILSHTFFYRHTEDFYTFYKSRMVYREAKPNPAHLALAELERRGKLTAVVTQNIDGLHQLGGSRNVMEIHGSVYRNHCLECGEGYGLDAVMDSPDIIPRCSRCGGILKPDVVLYEEQLDAEVLQHAISEISRADMLIVGGTSLVVYPAAGLVDYYRGDRLVLINKTETSYDHKANLVFHNSIGEVLNSIL